MTPTSERTREIHEQYSKTSKYAWDADLEGCTKQNSTYPRIDGYHRKTKDLNLQSEAECGNTLSLCNYVLKALIWLGPITKQELLSYIKGVPSAEVYALSWADMNFPGCLYSQEVEDAISELKALWFIEEVCFSVDKWVLLVTPNGKEFLKSLTCLKQQIAHWPQCDWECGNPPHVLCAVAGITEFREWTGSVKHITGTGPQQFEYIGNQPLVPSNKKMDSGR